MSKKIIFKNKRSAKKEVKEFLKKIPKSIIINGIVQTHYFNKDQKVNHYSIFTGEFADYGMADNWTDRNKL